MIDLQPRRTALTACIGLSPRSIPTQSRIPASSEAADIMNPINHGPFTTAHPGDSAAMNPGSLQDPLRARCTATADHPFSQWDAPHW